MCMLTICFNGFTFLWWLCSFNVDYFFSLMELQNNDKEDNSDKY